MAQTANSTITRIPHQSDAIFGIAAKEWENDICTLSDLADLTTSVIENIVAQHGKYPSMALGEDSKKHMLFCVYDIDRRMRHLKKKYFDAYNAHEALAAVGGAA